jgi:hypothetical protein
MPGPAGRQNRNIDGLCQQAAQQVHMLFNPSGGWGIAILKDVNDPHKMHPYYGNLGTTVEDKGFLHISSIVLAPRRLLNPGKRRKTPVRQHIPMYNLPRCRTRKQSLDRLFQPGLTR